MEYRYVHWTPEYWESLDRDHPEYHLIHKMGLNSRYHGGVVLAFTPKGIKAGNLKWYSATYEGQPNQIAMVHVEKEHRRQGLATRMWREAQKANPDIEHSSIRTTDGDPWAKSTGDEIPLRGSRSCSCCRGPYYTFKHYVEDTTHKILNETKPLEYA